LAFDEPVDPTGYRDQALLESAVNRPFCTYGGVDLYPTVEEKAAALFHSIISNHSFINGNKRTALMALDLFLAANGVFLLASNEDSYILAKQTAEANAEGRRPTETLLAITEKIKTESASLEWLNRLDLTVPGLNPDLPVMIPRIRHHIVTRMEEIRAHHLLHN
jgi:death-on-curing protein